ncbi:MAG: hypothetical protein WCP85_27550 [Mariniphaga sp.]
MRRGAWGAELGAGSIQHGAWRQKNEKGKPGNKNKVWNQQQAY